MNPRLAVYETATLPLSYSGNSGATALWTSVAFSERVTGIEPVSYPWEGYVLPLNHTRNTNLPILIFLRSFPRCFSPPAPPFFLLRKEE